MVRPANVARSRACPQCKKKRIKCDLGSPTCQRCIESNLVCSGPVSGLILLHHSPTSLAKGDTKARSTNVKVQFELKPQPILHNTLVPTDLYNEGLLFKFLEYFSQDAARRTWTARLPSLVKAKNHAAMKTAAKAVSLAFAAQTLNNPAMVQAACEYYGNCLRYHQYSFKAPTGKQICRKKAINALPVTVLLSYFEMIIATSPDAWLKHSLAAERLFVLLGPQALKDDLLNHLYFIVRCNSAIRCFLLGSKTQLLDQKWSAVPISRPCGRSNAVFNNLVDLILWLSIKINVATAKDDPHALNSTKLAQTLHKVNRLWQVFGETVGLDHRDRSLVPSDSDSSSDSTQPDPRMADNVVEASVPPQLQDFCAALTASFFHAAAILLLTLQWRHGRRIDPQSPNPPVHPAHQATMATIVSHASHILTLANYLRSQRIGCACLRMILPLTVIHRLSPWPQQRMSAEMLFREWSTGDGLAGLPVFAFGEKSPAVAPAVPFPAPSQELHWM